MDINIELNAPEGPANLFPTGCVLCKARKKSNGKIYLIIPGFNETHYIESDGDVTYTSRESQDTYLNQNYEFIEEVKLKWN